MRIYAKGLNEPRLMTIGPDGLLYIAEHGADAIVRLADANNDGLADENQVIASDLTGAHSLEWHENWLYVAEDNKIERLQDQNNDGDFETRELVTDNIPGPGGHSSRTLVWARWQALCDGPGLPVANNNPETDPRPRHHAAL